MPAVTNEGLHKRHYVAYLDCRHEIRYSVGEPSPGDKVFCTRCYDYRIIKHCANRFGASCRHCKYSKSYGGRISAMTFAEKHARKFRLHTVDVYGPEDFHAEVTEQAQLGLVECPF